MQSANKERISQIGSVHSTEKESTLHHLEKHQRVAENLLIEFDQHKEEKIKLYKMFKKYFVSEADKAEEYYNKIYKSRGIEISQ